MTKTEYAVRVQYRPGLDYESKVFETTDPFELDTLVSELKTDPMVKEFSVWVNKHVQTWKPKEKKPLGINLGPRAASIPSSWFGIVDSWLPRDLLRLLNELEKRGIDPQDVPLVKKVWLEIRG